MKIDKNAVRTIFTERLEIHSPWQRYLYAVLLVAVVSGLGTLVRPYISPTNLVMFYLLAVVIAAVRFGRGPSMLTAILSVVTFDVFFVPPYHTLAVDDAEYMLTFAALLIVGLVIATLAARMREHAQDAQQREQQTTALYALSREMSASMTLETVLKAVIDHIHQVFNGEVGIFLAQQNILALVQHTPNFPLDDGEQAAALWAYHHAGQKPLPSEAHYLPLKSGENMVGVLGIRFNTSEPLSPDRHHLLEAFASQAALGIEATNLAEKVRQAQLLQETEKLQTALLNSISHELRTPLVAITGALSSLRDHAHLFNPEARADLIDAAWEEADRLNHLVGNLLDMTRLEANAITLKKTPSDVQEMVGVALSNMQNRLAKRKVNVEIPPDLPLVEVDFVLMVQVFVNLLDNAVKYSPPDSLIDVLAAQRESWVEIHIADRGKGIQPQDFPHLFQKFYRAEDGGAGIGLGLSICQGLVEAHGGQIRAQNRPGGGTIFTLTLPRYHGENL